MTISSTITVSAGFATYKTANWAEKAGDIPKFQAFSDHNRWFLLPFANPITTPWNIILRN